MKPTVLLTLLLMTQLACQKSVPPTPYVPTFADIVGEWAIHRIVYSGFEAPLTARNRTDSSGSLLGSDTYVFNQDSSYGEQFMGKDFYSVDSSTLNEGTETGRWQVIANESVLKLNRATLPHSFIQEPYSATLTQANEFRTVYTYRYLLPGSSATAHRYTQEIYYRKKR
ncbi:hypothetical protein [Spirosoma endophyticum]|uniref:Lipocalin-like domain-containing protein n=1 Tax=Spirosoma endophyticum TaxID=662367 RepID=A0A1I2I0A5_9BACT|nr:hypothetical protein [Spirosoma endophyticum]SFF35724.1 hypothetical protein SAMN05216167_15311 [Spirosoma endophyticum]